MDVIAISLAQNILDPLSGDRARMRSYALALTSYHVVVLMKKKGVSPEHIRDGNLFLYPLSGSSRFGLLIRALREVRRIVRSLKQTDTILISQDPLELGWFTTFLGHLYHVPVQIQVHGDYFSSDAWIEGSLVRRVRRWGALQLLRRAKNIRVVSERIKSSLVSRGICDSKISVLPIRPEIESFLTMEHVYRSGEALTFLFVGRLAPEKNIQKILRAFRITHRACPHAVLKIVGTGEEEIELRQLVRKFSLEESVVFLPWTHDVKTLMNDADIFLLASRHEAYGLTLVEAMAVGLPIITTDVGCVGELIRDHTHALVAHTQGDEAYATLMIRMVQDPLLRERLGRSARTEAQKISQKSPQEYINAWVSSLDVS